VRQLVTEALVLALLGGGLGLLLAVWGIDGLVALGPNAVPRLGEVGLDGRVVAFTLIVSLGTGVAFGLVPALLASRPDLNDALKDGSRGSAGGRGRLRRALVVTEVALSMVLLVGTGLMARSFLRLREVDPGFRGEHVLTMTVSLPAPLGTPSMADFARYASYFHRAGERLGQLPGVVAAGAINIVPMSGNSTDFSFDIENYVPKGVMRPDNELREVTPGYFAAMSIPLVAGRTFTDGDVREAPQVVVINQAMARRYWPDGENPIGKRVKLHSGARYGMGWSTIVGIVGDVHHFGFDAPPRAEIYFPHAQLPRSSQLTLVIKTTGDPAAMAPSARAALAELDANQPVFDVRTMNEVMAQSLAPRRFALLLMVLFAVVALVLAAVGIYGVMSYTVAQRTQEIGIRVALGATPGDVLGMVVREGMLLVSLGLFVGMGAALALGRVVASLLYAVETSDLVTYAAIAATLASVALVAILIPARRATRVEPMLALRSE
jgi:putative ABC transport system permease protein